MVALARLPDRGVIEVSGADRVGFLQGRPGHAVWAALLTPQGKWLADFFMFADGARVLLDCERAQIPMLLGRLGRYRLRADATLADLSDTLAVYAAWNGVPEAPPSAFVAPDPRLPEAGTRILWPTTVADAGADTEAAWDRHRLALGLPDGSRDLESEKTVLLEAGFDELNGVSWTKGCYMGQELTARTKYRGLVKRRLVPVGIDGPAPAAGTPVMAGDSEAGTMRSSCGDLGLALLRPEAFAAPLSCGGARLHPRPPAWMRLPASVVGSAA
jgi:folate-binding protein YgfZ